MCPYFRDAHSVRIDVAKGGWWWEKKNSVVVDALAGLRVTAVRADTDILGWSATMSASRGIRDSFGIRRFTRAQDQDPASW